MGLLSKALGIDKFEQEQRSTTVEESTTTTTMTLDEALGLFANPNNIVPTEAKVMSLAPAKVSVDLISNAIASMPIELFKENEDGSIESVKKDRRIKLLNQQANDVLNGFNFKKDLVKKYLLHGVSYTRVVTAKNQILELHPLPAEGVTARRAVINGHEISERQSEIVLTFQTDAHKQINQGNKKEIKFRPYELIIALQESFDGLTSNGALKHGEKIFKQALAEMKVAQKFYDRGAMPAGLLNVQGMLDEEDAAEMRDKFIKLYGGHSNAANVIVLSDGTDFKPLTPAQLDTKIAEKYAKDIYQVFGIPEGMVTSGSQYQSLEQNQLHFLRNCLNPHINAIENALDKALLLEAEKDAGYFFRFNTAELARATEKERAETFEIQLRSGQITINEARAKLDKPPVKNGDGLLIESGRQLFIDGKLISGYDKSNTDNKKGDEVSNEENGTPSS